MLHRKQIRKSASSRERGLSMPEMAIGGVLFFTLAFGIIEVGRAMAAYNAIANAVRSGARYACMNTTLSETQVKNMVVYGTTTVGTRPIATGLTAANVFVIYSNNTVAAPGPVFGMNSGTVRVEVRNYRFNYNVPLVGTVIPMRTFSATANAESAGIIPGNI